MKFWKIYSTTEACSLMGSLQEDCNTDPKQCQLTNELSEVLKRTIKQTTQAMTSYARHCNMEAFPDSELNRSRCERGESWLVFNPIFEVYTANNQVEFRFRNGQMRTKRFVITVPTFIIMIGICKAHSGQGEF